MYIFLGSITIRICFIFEVIDKPKVTTVFLIPASQRDSMSPMLSTRNTSFSTCKYFKLYFHIRFVRQLKGVIAYVGYNNSRWSLFILYEQSVNFIIQIYFNWLLLTSREQYCAKVMGKPTISCRKKSPNTNFVSNNFFFYYF